MQTTRRPSFRAASMRARTSGGHAHPPAARADELDQLDRELVPDAQDLALAEASRGPCERLPLAVCELLEQQQLDGSPARPPRAQAARDDTGRVGDDEIIGIEQ